MSYTGIILMNLSKYKEITSLLYQVLLKEKNGSKKERRKKNKGRVDAELKKKLLKKDEQNRVVYIQMWKV